MKSCLEAIFSAIKTKCRGAVAPWSEKHSFEPKPIKTMKIVHKNAKGESRELLLKEYFLNAYLIAMLKRVGDEAARLRKRPAAVKAGA